MAYIGRDTDKISNVEVLDNITFDGSSSYTLQKGGSNFTPSSANTLLLSIDGVVQAGNFTVSGSTIDFGTAVAGTSTCDFVLHYGVGLITAPSDGTVTNAKISYPLAQSGAVVSSFNRTSSDGNILELQKDGTTVGSISSHSSGGIRVESSHSLELKSSATNGLRLDDAGIFRPQTDNVTDMGKSSNRFKDLYLSGGLYVGGTGTANQLDDYEEGTWTPSFLVNISGTVTSLTGTYTKVGRIVTISMEVTGTSLNLPTYARVTGMPFAPLNQSTGTYILSGIEPRYHGWTVLSGISEWYWSSSGAASTTAIYASTTYQTT